ncbi:tetratricopeptide repeat protein [Candidatus Palauibacter sp.]|uniref:tetratricopeptide repeat protein n=1 Tax=Candidatus Palauibacter sp. TaxID=3101350 RepID=UPI003B01D3B0
MRSMRNILSWVAAGVAVLSVPMAPRALEAQTGDLTILVATVAVTEPVDRRFGERIAEEVREALETFPGYMAIERDDARDLIDQFDLDERAMTPIDWRQLAIQMNASLVMLGTAAQADGGVEVDITFTEPSSGDELPMRSFVVADDDSHEEAAAHVMEQLGTSVEYARSLAFCADYLASEQPSDAISNCNAALRLSPESERAHYLRGRAQMLNEAWADAAADLQWVVDENPSSTEALEALAFTHAQLGNGAESLRYYQEFLGFQPDRVEVRMRIAYDLTQAGRWGEAVQLLKDGVERAPDNEDLLEYLAGAALQAGQAAGEVTDADMIREAVDASGKLVELQGDAVSPTTLSNATNAYMLIEEYDNALAFSDRALEAIAGSDATNGEGEMSREDLMAQVHSSRARIYDRLEDPATGVAELEQALEYNPDLENGRQQLATLKLKAGDTAGAVEDFRAAVAAGADPEQVANALFSQGFSRHFQAQQQVMSNPAGIDIGEVATALELFSVAAEFAQLPETSEQIHFFLAFGYYLQGSAYDARNEADEACGPARNALTAFQGVTPHLSQSGSYQAASQQQIRDAIDVQLYRQEQIIESSCSR